MADKTDPIKFEVDATSMELHDFFSQIALKIAAFKGPNAAADDAFKATFNALVKGYVTGISDEDAKAIVVGDLSFEIKEKPVVEQTTTPAQTTTETPGSENTSPEASANASVVKNNL